VLLVWLVRCAIVALACAAAATDVRRRVVPDWLTLPAMGVGLAAFAWRLHWTGAALWALGVAAPALPLLVPWLLGGVGGGDFKLAIAFGALGGAAVRVRGALLGSGCGGAAVRRLGRGGQGAGGDSRGGGGAAGRGRRAGGMARGGRGGVARGARGPAPVRGRAGGRGVGGAGDGIAAIEGGDNPA
jgi:hypothetical protein